MTNSQSDLNLALVIGMLLMACLIATVLYSYRLYQRGRAEYEARKHPSLVPFVAELLCNKPHDWTVVELGVRGLPTGQYQVCSDCGAIAGNQTVVLSSEVLAQIEQGKKAIAERLEVERAIAERVDYLVAWAVDRQARAEFPNEAQDLTFVAKLHEFAEFVYETRQEACDKVQAEFEAQKTSNKKYAGWETSVKGNA